MAAKEMELAIKIGGKVDKSLNAAINATKGAIGGIGKLGAAVGAAAMAGVAAVGAIGAAATKVGSEFESSMSQVAATMLLDKSTEEGAKNLQLLEDAARQCGRDTAFSASEAAEALNYLALAGYDAQKAADALPTILNLAGAGAMDLAAASDMVTDSMSALGIEATKTNLDEFADKLALTASKANTSVSQLGDAILAVGGTAKNLSGGTTELTEMLGILADNGIKGAEGGTKLRNMILSLQNPTKDAAKQLKAMGIEVYDAQGNMRGLDTIFTDMQKAMEGMDQSAKDNIISSIFNKADLAGANALLGTSADRYNELADAISNSKGAAEDMYNIQLDNLEGDIAKLKSGLSDLGISIYKDTGGPIRQVTKMATNMVSTLAKAYSSGGFSKALSTLGDMLLDGIKNALKQLPSLITEGANMLSEMLDGMISAVDSVDSGSAVNLGMGVFDAIANAIQTIFPKLLELGAKATMKLIDGLVQAAPHMLSVGLEMVTNFLTGLGQAIPQIGTYAINVISSLVDGILSNLPQLIASAGQVISTFISGLGQNNNNLFNAAIQMIPKIIQGLLSALPQLVMAAFQIVGALAGAIIQCAPNLLTAGLQIMQALWDGITGMDWASLGKQIMNAFINGIKSMASNVWGAIKGMIPGGADINVNANATVPAAHADGGIFTKPTLLNGGRDLVGEAGPEAILPLNTLFDKMRDIVGGQNGSTINYQPSFTINGGSKDEILEAGRQLQDEFESRMSQWMKQQKRTSFA